MTSPHPTRSSRAKGVIWIGLALALVLIALIAYPIWEMNERRQTLMDTQWTATLFLDIYLKNQEVPPLMLSPELQVTTVESRLVVAEKQYGNPLRRYHIRGWHFDGAPEIRTADLYYEVNFKKTAEPLHIRLVRQRRDWKVADVVWESPA